MKKAFDQNVSRAKPRLKLGAPSPEPAASEVRAPEEEWVYEVAAQVAGQPTAAEAQAPTAREVLAAAARATAAEEAEEISTRSRVEATLREAASVAEPWVVPEEEERVTVAVGARTRAGSANGAASGPTTVVSGPAPAPRTAGRPSTSAPPPPLPLRWPPVRTVAGGRRPSSLHRPLPPRPLPGMPSRPLRSGSTTTPRAVSG